jgi:hypothetical protein
MKRSILLTTVLTIACVMNSCRTDATPPANNENSGLLDQVSLLSALKAAGATPEIGDPITQDFLSVEGTLINLDQAKDAFQVFEYKTTEEMEADAAKVAPDGGSVGTSMMNWVMPPHFFKSGRILVLYLGDNQTTLNLLEKIMGKQFAGQ